MISNARWGGIIVIGSSIGLFPSISGDTIFVLHFYFVCYQEKKKKELRLLSFSRVISVVLR